MSRVMKIKISFLINGGFFKLINKGLGEKYKICGIFGLNIKYLSMNRIIDMCLVI